jgi:hypothetical protein
LEAITSNRLIIGAAFLICVATNLPLLTMAAVPRPDSPMNFFGAAALGVYVLIVFEGLTPLRAVSLSLLAVFAMTAKELAGTMFVLPYLGLIWTERRNSNLSERIKFWKSVSLLVGTGIVAYALLNIVYVPETWLQRMNYWLSGPGIDPGVWGNDTGLQRLQGVAISIFDNLGPGGAILALVAVGFFYWKRPKHWILLSLPLASLYFVGLARMGYQEDRFFTLAAVSLVPMVVAGLAAFVQEFRSTQTLAACASAAVMLISINVWYASAAWLFLGQMGDSLLESGISSLACPGADVWVFNTFEAPPASRYTLLGYRADRRSASEIMRSSRDQLPQVAMASVSELQFFEDARSRPARADLLRHELDFDISKWHGMGALGYPGHRIVAPEFPRWFCFTWMPTVKTFIARNTVVFYSRPCSGSTAASASTSSPNEPAAIVHSQVDSR